MKNRLKKREKWFWESRFGIMNRDLDTISPEVDRFNFRDSDMNDEDMYWISTRILKNLKLILVNSDNGELAIRRKVNKLCDIFPDCEFIVNRRRYGRRNDSL